MSSRTLLKEKLPTPAQMDALLRFVDRGSLSSAFGTKVAQAAATQQLNRIDAALGVRTRKSAGTRKVPSGEAIAVARYCREFLQQLADFKASSGGRPNTFRIGAGDTLSFYLLIPSLPITADWRSKVEIHLTNLRSREIVRGLLDGTLDLGLVRDDAIKEPQTKRRLKSKAVCTVEYDFCVREDLLAGYGADRSDETKLLSWCIQHLPLATFYSEMSEFTKALGKTRLEWTAKLRCSSFPQVKEAVESGGYCGILPSIAFTPATTRIVKFGRMHLSAARRKIVLVWSSSLTQRRAGGEVALRELQSALKRHCA
jgi:DNA-binding transcriptional LysR family regulator